MRGDVGQMEEKQSGGEGIEGFERGGGDPDEISPPRKSGEFVGNSEEEGSDLLGDGVHEQRKSRRLLEVEGATPRHEERSNQFRVRHQFGDGIFRKNARGAQGFGRQERTHCGKRCGEGFRFRSGEERSAERNESHVRIGETTDQVDRSGSVEEKRESCSRTR